MQTRFAALGMLAALSAGLTLPAPAMARKAPVIDPPGRFTFTPPPGWHLATAPVPYRLRCIATPRGDGSAIVSVQETASPLSVDRYIQKLLRAIIAVAPQTRLLSQAPFVTTSGLHGYRAAFGKGAGQSVQFVLYAFPGNGGHKFLVAGLWPASDTAKYQAAVNASMKTFAVK